MHEITLSDALSLANGAKKAMAEGYEARYMPYMAMAAAKLADELTAWKSRAEAAENVLQNLMSFLSVSGSRTDIDPANAELRIRDGIRMLVKPALARAEAAEEELRKAREQESVGEVCSNDWGKAVLYRDMAPEQPLYAAPKPAASIVDDVIAQRIALAVYDYQNRISDEPLMHAINRILIKGSHLLSAEYLAQMQSSNPAVPEATCNDNLQVPREWREMLEFLISQRGKAGHSHRRPGIWDDDNGVLAGKPCDVCAMYDRARALLGAKP